MSTRGPAGKPGGSPQHVAVVTQNSDLVVDLRPRMEAEALSAAGFAVTLVGPASNASRLRELVREDVTLQVYPRAREAGGVAAQLFEQSFVFYKTVAALRAAARRRPIDIIHAGNPPDDSWLFPWFVPPAGGTRPRFVFDQHDVVPILVSAKYGSGLAVSALEKATSIFEARSFSSASLVVFANDEYPRRASRARLLQSPWEVVPNGWSLPEIYTERDWRKGARYLLAYVGAIGEQDDVDHLVEAVAQLPARDDVRVVLAGDGSARALAERRAGELGLGTQFEWLGNVRDREILASIVRSADVCIAPETDTEFNRHASFVKIGEYMSAVRPVAAHRLPQTAELAADAIEFADQMNAKSLADAIQRLLDDPDRAHRMAAAGRRRFEMKLSWENVGAPRLVAAYERVFGVTEPLA